MYIVSTYSFLPPVATYIELSVGALCSTLCRAIRYDMACSISIRFVLRLRHTNGQWRRHLRRYPATTSDSVFVPFQLAMLCTQTRYLKIKKIYRIQLTTIALNNIIVLLSITFVIFIIYSILQLL